MPVGGAEVFKPRDRAELKAAVDESLALSSDGSKGPHGPIGEGDVSSGTDMGDMFCGAASFNADISASGNLQGSPPDVIRVQALPHLYVVLAIYVVG